MSPSKQEEIKCKICEEEKRNYSVHTYNTIQSNVESGGKVLTVKDYGCSNGHDWKQ